MLLGAVFFNNNIIKMKLKIIYKDIEVHIEYERYDTFTYQLSAIKEVIQTTIKEYNNK